MHLLGFKVHWLGSWTCREAARTPKTKQMHGRCAHRNQKHEQMHGRCAHSIFRMCTPTKHLQTFSGHSFENVYTYLAFAAFHGPPFCLQGHPERRRGSRIANGMQQMHNRSAQLNDTLVKNQLVFDYQRSRICTPPMRL